MSDGAQHCVSAGRMIEKGNVWQRQSCSLYNRGVRRKSFIDAKW